MPFRMYRIVGVPLAAVLLAFGCSPRPNNAAFAIKAVHGCPNFVMTADSFVITPTAGFENLGGGNRVMWDDSAVAVPQTYYVDTLAVNGQKVAGVAVTPASGNAGLAAPVRLRLSYAACVPSTSKKLYIARRPASSDPWQKQTGFHSKGSHFVEVFVEEFSDWAIAD